MFQDFRLASRRTLRSPLSALVSAATLAIGVGLSTAVYACLHSIFRPPLGVQEYHQVVKVEFSDGRNISVPQVRQLQQTQQVFSEVMAWRPELSAIGGVNDIGRAFGEVVSGNYFKVLGVAPAVGRLILEADDHLGAPPVIVISHRYWQRVFDGRTDAIGRTLLMEGVQREVVGVVAAPFAGLVGNGVMPSAYWIPLSSTTSLITEKSPASRAMTIFARLQPGQSLAQATAGLRTLPPLPPDARPGHLQATLARDDQFGKSTEQVARPLAVAILAMTWTVFLVCAVNVVALMIARGQSIRTEMRVRFALGATRRRLMMGFLPEALFVGVVSLGGAWLIARVLTASLTARVSMAGYVDVFDVAPRIDQSGIELGRCS